MTASNLRLGLVLGIVLSAAIVITNVVWPSLTGNPSPDNAMSESIGWICVVLLVCGAGYLRMRNTSKLAQSAIAGGEITFIAFAIAMITFLVIDNMFLDIVSQQPEKVWLFEHSGFADMRSYLNHANVRALWTALPIVTLLGAICGIIGGLIGWFARRPSRS